MDLFIKKCVRPRKQNQYKVNELRTVENVKYESILRESIL